MKLVKAFKKTKKKAELTLEALAGSRSTALGLTPTLAVATTPSFQTKRSVPEDRCVAPAVSTPAMTTIEALIDVGFGNQLFLRGQGGGLSWDRGTPLECVDSQTWRWSAATPDNLTFKLLLNDTVWAQGEDVVATPGKCIGIVPKFW